MNNKKYLIIFTLIITVFILSACGNSNASLTATSTSEADIIQTAPTVDETPTALDPTEVVNSTLSLYIYLENSENYFPENSDLETLISEFENAGLEVTSTSELPPSDQFFSFALLFNPTLETIDLFDTGLVNHLLIVSKELTNQPSTKTTLFSMSPADRVFIGGYLAAIITEDWRVGGLLPSLVYENTSLSTIFQNGVEFMCGRCLPIYGPMVDFPVTATLTTANDTEMTMQAFSDIYNNRINSLYIPSPYLYDDFVILLQQNGIIIISDGNPGNDHADWIDYAVEDNLATLLENSVIQENQDENFSVEAVEYSIYSKFDDFPLGKANFIQSMMDDLKKGYISPFSALQE